MERCSVPPMSSAWALLGPWSPVVRKWFARAQRTNAFNDMPPFRTVLYSSSTPYRPVRTPGLRALVKPRTCDASVSSGYSRPGLGPSDTPKSPIADMASAVDCETPLARITFGAVDCSPCQIEKGVTPSSGANLRATSQG